MTDLYREMARKGGIPETQFMAVYVRPDPENIWGHLANSFTVTLICTTGEKILLRIMARPISIIHSSTSTGKARFPSWTRLPVRLT